VIRGDYFLFGLVFIQKQITKPNLKKKPKSIQNDQFQFGFLEQKPVQTGLARIFSGLARFSGLIWVQFGLVFSVSGL